MVVVVGCGVCILPARLSSTTWFLFTGRDTGGVGRTGFCAGVGAEGVFEGVPLDTNFFAKAGTAPPLPTGVGSLVVLTGPNGDFLSINARLR